MNFFYFLKINKKMFFSSSSSASCCSTSDQLINTNPTLMRADKKQHQSQGYKHQTEEHVFLETWTFGPAAAAHFFLFSLQATT